MAQRSNAVLLTFVAAIVTACGRPPRPVFSYPTDTAPAVPPAERVLLGQPIDSSAGSEYAVYRFVLGWQVRVNHRRTLLLIDTAAAIRDDATDLRRYDTSLVAGFRSANTSPLALNADSLVGAFTVRLLSASELDRPDWSALDRRFPGAMGISRLSRVGFNASRTRAAVYFVLYCSASCGEGGFVVLARVPGRAWTLWAYEPNLRM